MAHQKRNIEKNSPEGQILLVVWRTIISYAGFISEYYRWILTGVAAALVLIVANLDSLLNVIEKGNLKWSIIFLVVSILFGFVSYALSISLKLRGEVNSQIESILSSQQAQNTVSQMQLSPEEFSAELIRPVWGPLAWWMRKSFNKGMKDGLANEKGSMKLFTFISYSMSICLLSATISIFILVFGIK